MEVNMDDRGNYTVYLNNDKRDFINDRGGYYYNAPEIASWAPEWLVVPVLEYYVRGELVKPQTPPDAPQGGDSRLHIPNFYGGSVLDPSRINYPPGMPKWVIVEDEWKKDDTGLYYWTIAKQGFRIYIERHILDVLREVHGSKYAGEGASVPIIPAWKGGNLVARMVPFTTLEQHVVDPPYNDPEEYVEINEVEDITTETGKVKTWKVKDNISFEELVSAGYNLSGADSAVIVEKPFKFGVVYHAKGITSTFTPKSQGLPVEWKRAVIKYYEKIEELGGAGAYYLPLSDFTLLRTCAGDSVPPMAYMVPSAWAFVLDFTANGPIAYLDSIVREELSTTSYYKPA